MAHEHRVPFASMAWDAPAAGARSKAHTQGGSRLRVLELTSEFVEHDWCTAGHIGYVLEGHMEISFGGRVESFGPGDGLVIPAGASHKHKARVLTDRVRLVLVEEAP